MLQVSLPFYLFLRNYLQSIGAMARLQADASDPPKSNHGVNGSKALCFYVLLKGS